MDKDVLSIISASCGQLVKMLITLEPHGIFDYLFIFWIWQEKWQRKEKKKILVTLVFEPLFLRLLDYKKAS